MPTIAPATLAQLPAMAALFDAQLREHHIDSAADDLLPILRLILDHPEHGFLLTAICDDAVVGVAYAACLLSLEHCGHAGWLEELYILPDWRERSLGSLLLDAVIAGAQQRRWIALDLEVDTHHQRVISLYNRRHFQPVHRTRFVRRLQET